MFQINRNYCCKTEEQLLYNVMELLAEINAKLSAQGPAEVPPPAKTAAKRAGRDNKVGVEAGASTNRDS